MPPTLATADFLLRNAASIGRGLLTRCARPSLMPMKLHQHEFSASGQRVLDMGLGRLVLRALLRVAVTLLIAIPLLLVVVTAFALAGRRRASLPLESGVSRAKPVTS
jgi:hypothetical protein